MQWCLQLSRLPILKLVHATPEHRVQVNEAIRELAGAGQHPQAKTFAKVLESAILKGVVTPEFLERLGNWCDAQNPRHLAREPAQHAALAMFNRIVPRNEGENRAAWFNQFCGHCGIQLCATSPSKGSAGRAEGSRTGKANKGSQYCLQRFVEDSPDDLADLIIAHSPTLQAFGTSKVEWRSPLGCDDYYEYGDDYLVALDLDHQEQQDQQAAFWPDRGPDWDALAKVTGASVDGVLLVEAKAYPKEARGTCKAENPNSIQTIRRAFARVQEHMGVRGVTPELWMRRHYQAANRLAHLYLLNEVMQIPTWLVFVNFLDDQSNRPTDLRTWRPQQVAMFRQLGLHPGCRLLDRVVTLFIRPLEVNARP